MNRVLLVEDNAAYAEVIKIKLDQIQETQGPAGAFETVHVELLADGKAKLGAEHFDVVLLDLTLPDSEGLETVAAMHEHSPSTPIVVLTSMDDENLAVEAISRGAQDYLVKDRANIDVLRRSIRYAKERNRNFMELHKTQEELSHANKDLRRAQHSLEKLVHIDPLTELLNRRGLQQALSRSIHEVQRDASVLMAILIDLDDFRHINTQIGHAAGDVVLTEVGYKLRSKLRATDYIARIGGDEYIVLLPNIRPAEAKVVAEKIRLSISSKSIPLSHERVVNVTASLGVITVTKDMSSIDEILDKTHGLLYQSKQLGKNRVSNEFQSGKLKPVLDTVLEAVKRGNAFKAYAQPIYKINDESIIGYELLSRLDVKEFPMPDDFFRACGEANMLTFVDHKCYKNCIDATRHLPSNRQYHINLFPSTLIGIPIEHLLEEIPKNAPDGSYCVEISEQQLIGDPSYLHDAVKQFKDNGVHIAIDDVGFGNSCLESLILLEPNTIKIDKRIIMGIASQTMLVRSLRRLLKLAASLDIEVVAEGVENREDLQVILDLGVKYAQGFLWGRPCPYAELAEPDPS